MHRFFVPVTDITGSFAVVRGEDAHHITNVIRLEIGEKVVLCDGQGYDYLAEIKKADKQRVELAILEKHSSSSEPAVRVTLYQGLPKASKMELVIQKCVELGAYAFIPVSTERAVVKLSDSDGRKKADRWQKIAEEAAKQSGRGIIPRVSEPVAFDKAVASSDHDLKLMLWEDERANSLRSVLTGIPGKPGSVAVMIGPEGGISAKEAGLAKEYGWIPVSVGPRILRTETAGMAAIAAIMYQMEEMEWTQHP